MYEKMYGNLSGLSIFVHHNILIRQVEEFGRFKVFSDITYQNIADFDLFLRKTINSQPTLYKRHCAFKSYIVDAINRGICKSNPYLQFKVQKGKSITSHVARHTFATYLLNNNIPIETVSKAMGHSNIKMTQHYAKLLGKKVVSDMIKLLK
jgi:integrase